MATRFPVLVSCHAVVLAAGVRPVCGTLGRAMSVAGRGIRIHQPAADL
jgi:hypothetical protein